MKDATNRTLRQGQVVEMMLNSIFRGTVVDIVPASTIVGSSPQSQPHPGFAVIQVMVQLVADPRSGQIQGAYIVQEPDRKPGQVHPFKSDGARSENEPAGDILDVDSNAPIIKPS